MKRLVTLKNTPIDELFGNLPGDLEQSARQTGALSRKLRKFAGPKELLWALLGWIAHNLSSRQGASLAQEIGVADIAHPSLWERLIYAGPWLKFLALGLLSEQAEQLDEASQRIRLVDGSRLHPKHAKNNQQTTFLLHGCLDQKSDLTYSLQVTPLSEGESLKQYPVHTGDLLIADRYFAQPGPLFEVIGKGADVLVRMMVKKAGNFQHEDGTPVDFLALLGTLEQPGDTQQWPMWIQNPQDAAQRAQGRLVAIKKTPQAEQAEIKRQKEKARTHHRPFSPAAEAACAYTMVFTTLPAQSYSPEAVLNLYRKRWNIEIFFRRFKQLTRVEARRFRKPEMAEAWIWGQILLYLLVEKTRTQAADFFPSPPESVVA